jgi:hypothetical protein
MKNATKILAAVLFVCCGVAPAHAERFNRRATRALEVCPKIEKLSTSGYIYKNAAPLRSGGEGTPLIGYEEVPTLIMKKNVSFKGKASVYDLVGNQIARCPWKPATGFAGGRYKCANNTRKMRKKAVTAAGSAAGLFKINTNLCIQIEDLGRCYGSVKGKCNQLLK